MGFWDWLPGNSIRQNNCEKIARAKKELLFMPTSQKIQKLKEISIKPAIKARLKKNLSENDIYECEEDLSSEFLIYYFIFNDKSIRLETEIDKILILE